jgi:hypothetical protein
MRLLAHGARALHDDGDLATSRQRFDEAYRLAETERDWAGLAQAAVGLGGIWVHEHRGLTDSALIESRLRHALSVVDGPAETVRIRARLAAEADYRDGTDGRILAVVAEARSLGDPAVLAEAVSLAHHCVLGPARARQRHALADELIQLAHRTSRRGDLLIGLLWKAVDLLLDGDPHADRSFAELREQLRRADHLAIRYVLEAVDVMRAIRGGHLDRAAERAEQCRATGARAGDVDAAGWHGAHRIAIAWFQGRVATLLPEIRAMAGSPALSVVDNSFVAALAVAEAAAGEHRLARGTLARLAGRGLAALPRSASWLVTLYAVVEAAHLVGDVELSAQAYELLAPHADRPMTGSLGIVCFGSVRLALGVASLTMDDPDRAVEHLRRAVRHSQALGHWPAVVLSRARLAQALIGRADLAEAAAVLRQAGEEAAQLGLALPTFVEGSAPPAAHSHRHGARWQIRLGARSVWVRHSKGMAYLAVLIANPGGEILAADLAGGTAEVSAQAVLDDEAKRAYRRRLAELDEAIDRFEERGDDGGALRARQERGWLIDQLAAASGLLGRSRRFSDGAERARISVGKAIRRALDQIEAADPVIGAHLRANVWTGMRCGYVAG